MRNSRVSCWVKTEIRGQCPRRPCGRVLANSADTPRERPTSAISSPRFLGVAKEANEKQPSKVLHPVNLRGTTTTRRKPQMKGAFYVGPPLLSDLSGRRKTISSPFLFSCCTFYLASFRARACRRKPTRASHGWGASQRMERARDSERKTERKKRKGCRKVMKTKSEILKTCLSSPSPLSTYTYTHTEKRKK